MGTQNRTVLFLCTGNSCRSQMAEGFARQAHKERITALSAGVQPKGLDPRAAVVMAEVGIDISGQGSTDIREYLEHDIDLVITVCGHADEQCPVFPRRTRVVHRGFDDPPRLVTDDMPEPAALAVYRRVRDEIKEFVQEHLVPMLDTSSTE